LQKTPLFLLSQIDLKNQEDRVIICLIHFHQEEVKMPIYEYQCDKCGKTFEIFQKMADKPLTECRVCKGGLHKLISQCSFQLKGTGWYVTDYKKPVDATGNGGKRTDKKEETSDAKTETIKETISESKTEAKAETKTEAKTEVKTEAKTTTQTGG
jgi:putative FmdB family regulatory protein